ncbi:MAG: glycosyltransferase family 2 protein [Thermoleophilia bacterium]
MSSDVRLSVVVPCYNEEAVIVGTYDRLKETCEAQAVTYEIIFGNDGSTDSTIGLLEALAGKDPAASVISHQPNRGAGFTYREMYAVARGEIIIQMDADLAMPPEVAVPAFLQALDEADLVVGSRYVGVEADYPLKRRIFSKGYIALTHALFRLDIKDTQTGCIGFHRRVLDGLTLESDGFEMLLELIVKAGRAGFRTREVGLPWFHDTASGETEVFRESIKMLTGTLRVRRGLGRAKSEAR